MATQRTRALMLRSVDFGESDRILHLLLPDTGRVTAIAKGAKRSVKRFSGALDLFNLLHIDIDRRRPNAMARLDQASVIGHFPTLRVDPARFALGCYLLELLDRMAPEGGARPDMQRLFAFAQAALGMIADRRPDDRLRTLLELRALDALGLRPELIRCVRCGSEPEEATLGFHVGDGGPVCAGCRGAGDALLPVHRGTLRSLDRGLRFDIDQLDRLVLSEQALQEARSLVSRFQHFHVGIPLKSEAFLDRVLTGPSGSPN